MILGESSSTKYTVRTTLTVVDGGVPFPPSWEDKVTLEGVVIVGEPNGCDTDTARSERVLKGLVKEHGTPGQDWAVFRRGAPRVHRIFIRVPVPYSFVGGGNAHVVTLQVNARDGEGGAGGVAVQRSAWDKMAAHILSAFHEERG